MTKDTLVHDMLVAANFNHTPYRDGMEAALRVAEDHYCRDLDEKERYKLYAAIQNRDGGINPTNAILAARRLTTPADTRRERIRAVLDRAFVLGDYVLGDYKDHMDKIMAIVNEVKP